MKERKRNRLEGFDYNGDALYFITPCTQYRNHYFGEIHQGEMKTNEFGQIAKKTMVLVGRTIPVRDFAGWQQGGRSRPAPAAIHHTQ